MTLGKEMLKTYGWLGWFVLVKIVGIPTQLFMALTEGLLDMHDLLTRQLLRALVIRHIKDYQQRNDQGGKN
jgi:hypothetical protein